MKNFSVGDRVKVAKSLLNFSEYEVLDSWKDLIKIEFAGMLIWVSANRFELSRTKFEKEKDDLEWAEFIKSQERLEREQHIMKLVELEKNA